MKTSTTKTSRIALALTLASVISGLAVTPAFADRHDHDRGHREWHHHGYYHGGGYRSYGYPYAYAQPVYAPPPVYYPPEPSPGVSLFFPINIR